MDNPNLQYFFKHIYQGYDPANCDEWPENLVMKSRSEGVRKSCGRCWWERIRVEILKANIFSHGSWRHNQPLWICKIPDKYESREICKFPLTSVNHLGLPKKFLSYMTLLNLSLRSRILLAAISKGGKGLAASWKWLNGYIRYIDGYLDPERGIIRIIWI